jgi:hypothetical protein
MKKECVLDLDTISHFPADVVVNLCRKMPYACRGYIKAKKTYLQLQEHRFICSLAACAMRFPNYDLILPLRLEEIYQYILLHLLNMKEGFD